jgi:excisionase family DNA binding protein
MDDANTEGLGRFLTLADTAELLNISPKQTYALIRSGELPAIKVGASGHWRIERSVIEAYIDAMYEETRRMSLWNQSEFANLTEPTFG